MLNTPYREGIAIPLMVASSMAITEGVLVAVNSSGQAVPATDAGAKYILGRSEMTVTTGATQTNSQITVTRNRQFLLGNDATNPLTAADIGEPVVLTAKNTVGKITAGGASKLGVGVLMGVDYSGQVWVEIGGGRMGVLSAS